MKCLSLSPDDHEYMRANTSTWYCMLCVTQIFPLNTIEDDDIFLCELNGIDIDDYTIDSLSCRLFNPFQLNDKDYYTPLSQIDPDVNFYNNVNSHLGLSCNYYLENTFYELVKSQMHNSTTENGFSLCHLNIRSLRANLSAFELTLHNLRFHFTAIGISETWLNDHNCDLYDIAGYNLIEVHRHTKKGGGVGIFLDNNIPYQIRSNLCLTDDVSECVFIEIDKEIFKRDKNIIIGVIYRPPNSDLDAFNSSISLLLSELMQENKHCYIMGDYNINLLNYENHQLTAEFVDQLHSNSFVSLINKPTRVKKHSATLIDNIFTNSLCDKGLTIQGIIYSDISDHFPIVHIDYSFQVPEIDTLIVLRNMSYRNKQAFHSAVSEIDWETLYISGNAQESFTWFHSTLLKLFNKHFPKRTVTKKYNTRKPWLSQSLKDAIKTKNKLYVKLIKLNTTANEVTYKRYRNKLNHILKYAERKHFQDILEQNKHNLKKTWQIFKNIVNKNKTCQVNPKFKLNDGSCITDKATISSKFNDFFVNIGPNLAKKIPSQNIFPLQFMGDPLVTSIFLPDVTIEEINEIITSLKNGAAGWDEFTPNIIKDIRSLISFPLVHICNLSLQQGIFPDELKIANVLPLFKACDPCVFNNYRPVSLLCVLSKVYEKVMYNRLIAFLENFYILFENQFGFRKLHSSYMALMVLTDKLIRSLENGEFVIGVYLDFSKAFDTVDHEILLSKLSHYGIRGNCLNWFQSYLSNRKQFVTYNGVSSPVNRITCGVPQGSILGPLLFLLYINDLGNMCFSTTSILFADDTNIFKIGNNLKEMEDELNSELSKISIWLRANKLSLNIGKTHFMLFSNKKRRHYDLNIKIDETKIEEVKKTKFLGVIIDNKLTWKDHVAHVASKVSRGMGMIIKARNYLNRKGLLTLYYTFVYPYLTYCNHIWGNIYQSNLKHLCVLQNKIVRIIAGVKPRESTGPLYDSLGIMKLTDLNKYLIARFMFRYCTNMVPKLFSSYFLRNYNVSSYDLRSANCFHLPLVATDLGKNGIRYRGPIVFNKLLIDGIDCTVSEAVFVNQLKRSIKTGKL